MDLLALTHLICGEEDPYIERANKMVHERYVTMMKALGLPADETAENTQYYTLIDLREVIEAKYDHEFAEWITKQMDDLEFLDDLAMKKGVVLMLGAGFAADDWSAHLPCQPECRGL